VSRLDVLPADQRAVLQLVLGQGRSYAEIAGLLDLRDREVADRAHSGLDALAPEAGRRLTPGRRHAIGDWLLGQSGEADAAETAGWLAGSATGRAWARQVSDALAPLGAGALPAIPAAETEAGPPASEPEPESGEPAEGRAADSGRAEIPRASKIGGALLLLAIIGLVVVAIVTLTGGDNDAASGSAASTSAGGATTAAPSTTAGSAPVPRAQINLQPVDGGAARGYAVLVTQGNSAGFVIFGQGLPPSGQQLYGVWLVNGSRSLPLGFRPVGANGRFAANAPVPANAAQFREMVITRENVRAGQRTPPRPGQVVLRGSLASQR